jgi:hypothetical protein
MKKQKRNAKAYNMHLKNAKPWNNLWKCIQISIEHKLQYMGDGSEKKGDEMCLLLVVTFFYLTSIGDILIFFPQSDIILIDSTIYSGLASSILSVKL